MQADGANFIPVGLPQEAWLGRVALPPPKQSSVHLLLSQFQARHGPWRKKSGRAGSNCAGRFASPGNKESEVSSRLFSGVGSPDPCHAPFFSCHPALSKERSPVATEWASGCLLMALLHPECSFDKEGNPLVAMREDRGKHHPHAHWAPELWPALQRIKHSGLHCLGVRGLCPWINLVSKTLALQSTPIHQI